MTLKRLPDALTVCKLRDIAQIDLAAPFYFIGRTDAELSLVCRTCDTPAETLAREDGWRGFVIEGELDFSLIGILAEISGLLAKEKIGIFAVSTYNTDYILVKEENIDRAAKEDQLPRQRNLRQMPVACAALSAAVNQQQKHNDDKKQAVPDLECDLNQACSADSVYKFCHTAARRASPGRKR